MSEDEIRQLRQELAQEREYRQQLVRALRTTFRSWRHKTSGEIQALFDSLLRMLDQYD